jgi:salicylate hydroxylase
VSRQPVLIAGGGIGGLAAARALSIAGQQTIVVEQARAFEEIGAGIQLGPNGLRMLETLGLREQVARSAVFPGALLIMDGVSAEPITCVPVTDDFYERFGQPYALVHRADLHRALLDSCMADPNVELHTSNAVVSY